MRTFYRSLFFKMSLLTGLAILAVFGSLAYLIFRIQAEQALDFTRNQAVILTR